MTLKSTIIETRWSKWAKPAYSFLDYGHPKDDYDFKMRDLKNAFNEILSVKQEIEDKYLELTGRCMG